jgi:protein TonB
LFQPRSIQAAPFAERVRAVAGRRAVGIGLTLLIEALMLLVLLTLGPGKQRGVEHGQHTIVSFRVEEVSEQAPETRRPESEQRPPTTQRSTPDDPRPAQPVEPEAAPPPISILRTPWQLPPSPAAPQNINPPAQPARPAYGPQDNRSPAMRDTERVGTAPNGEPLYAAEWYREPDENMLRSYLSGARGPGWGLIACRTAPDFRVEDCVALSEYPEGSQINRAVLAAAWEFRVRPPRLGGRPLVGSWVRIRISYDMSRR